MTLTDTERADLISEIVNQLSPQFAASTVEDDVSALQGWKAKMVADGSFGRVFNGPQWLDGVAMRDGAVSGKKLSAQLVISNLFTTVDETLTPTADRMNLDATSLRAYGTVFGTPNTKTMEIKATGDFTLGTTNPITYVAATGVLTVPAAVIGSLTIANVGAGVIGGLYKTSNSNAHLEIDTSGIRMYDSGAVKTFDAAAATGALALTGALTVGTGGQINFGASAADYLSNNILHFEVGSSEVARIEILNGANTPRSRFAGYASSTSSYAAVKSSYDGTFNGAGQISIAPNHESYVEAYNTSAVGGVNLYGTYATTAASRASISISGGSTVATTFVQAFGGTYGKIYLDTDSGSAYGRLQIQGRLYPGSDIGQQTAAYIGWDSVNSRIVISGAPVSMLNGLLLGSASLQSSATGGASGALPTPTKWWSFFDPGASAFRYVPIFTSPGPWAA